MFGTTRIFGPALLLAIAASAAAVADESATKIIPQSGAPVALTRCSVPSVNGYYTSSINAFNRSTHALIDFSVDFRFYDADNTQIGKFVGKYPLSETTAPADTATINGAYIYPVLSEPQTAVSRISCRVTAAHFTGQHAWLSGEVWRAGPLSKVPSASDSSERNPAASGSNAMAADLPSSNVGAWTFDVADSWNDVGTTGLFVHDTIVVHGGNTDATVRSANFRLRMDLANGSKKMYAALASAAPQYFKYNALTGTNVPSYQVDPQQDLGRLGALIVPAHGTVRVTITFPVADVVSDPHANRAVTTH